jgi:ectoine hydroxylase-related dioxygenase (phytanoyl-CoA dioxygenase family)
MLLRLLASSLLFPLLLPVDAECSPDSTPSSAVHQRSTTLSPGDVPPPRAEEEGAAQLEDAPDQGDRLDVSEDSADEDSERGDHQAARADVNTLEEQPGDLRNLVVNRERKRHAQQVTDEELASSDSEPPGDSDNEPHSDSDNEHGPEDSSSSASESSGDESSGESSNESMEESREFNDSESPTSSGGGHHPLAPPAESDVTSAMDIEPFTSAPATSASRGAGSSPASSTPSAPSAGGAPLRVNLGRLTGILTAGERLLPATDSTSEYSSHQYDVVRTRMHEDGYVLLRGLLPRKLIEACAAATRLLKREMKLAEHKEATIDVESGTLVNGDNIPAVDYVTHADITALYEGPQLGAICENLFRSRSTPHEQPLLSIENARLALDYRSEKYIRQVDSQSIVGNDEDADPLLVALPDCLTVQNISSVLHTLFAIYESVSDEQRAFVDLLRCCYAAADALIVRGEVAAVGRLLDAGGVMEANAPRPYDVKPVQSSSFTFKSIQFDTISVALQNESLPDRNAVFFHWAFGPGSSLREHAAEFAHKLLRDPMFLPWLQHQVDAPDEMDAILCVLVGRALSDKGIFVKKGPPSHQTLALQQLRAAKTTAAATQREDARPLVSSASTRELYPYLSDIETRMRAMHHGVRTSEGRFWNDAPPPNHRILPGTTWHREKPRGTSTVEHVDYFFFYENTRLMSEHFASVRADRAEALRHGAPSAPAAAAASSVCVICRSRAKEHVPTESDAHQCEQCHQWEHHECIKAPRMSKHSRTSGCDWLCYRCRNSSTPFWTVWIPLVDIKGPGACHLMLLPGSHRSLDGYHFAKPGDLTPKAYAKMRSTATFVSPTEMDQGDIIIFNWKTVHASQKNMQAISRISLDTRVVQLVEHRVEAVRTGHESSSVKVLRRGTSKAKIVSAPSAPPRASHIPRASPPDVLSDAIVPAARSAEHVSSRQGRSSTIPPLNIPQFTQPTSKLKAHAKKEHARKQPAPTAAASAGEASSAAKADRQEGEASILHPAGPQQQEAITSDEHAALISTAAIPLLEISAVHAPAGAYFAVPSSAMAPGEMQPSPCETSEAHTASVLLPAAAAPLSPSPGAPPAWSGEDGTRVVPSVAPPSGSNGPAPGPAGASSLWSAVDANSDVLSVTFPTLPASTGLDSWSGFLQKHGSLVGYYVVYRRVAGSISLWELLPVADKHPTRTVAVWAEEELRPYLQLVDQHGEDSLEIKRLTYLVDIDFPPNMHDELIRFIPLLAECSETGTCCLNLALPNAYSEHFAVPDVRPLGYLSMPTSGRILTNWHKDGYGTQVSVHAVVFGHESENLVYTLPGESQLQAEQVVRLRQMMQIADGSEERLPHRTALRFEPHCPSHMTPAFASLAALVLEHRFGAGEAMFIPTGLSHKFVKERRAPVTGASTPMLGIAGDCTYIGRTEASAKSNAECIVAACARNRTHSRATLVFFHGLQLALGHRIVLNCENDRPSDYKMPFTPAQVRGLVPTLEAYIQLELRLIELTPHQLRPAPADIVSVSAALNGEVKHEWVCSLCKGEVPNLHIARGDSCVVCAHCLLIAHEASASASASSHDRPSQPSAQKLQMRLYSVEQLHRIRIRMRNFAELPPLPIDPASRKSPPLSAPVVPSFTDSTPLSNTNVAQEECIFMCLGWSAVCSRTSVPESRLVVSWSEEEPPLIRDVSSNCSPPRMRIHFTAPIDGAGAAQLIATHVESRLLDDRPRSLLLDVERMLLEYIRLCPAEATSNRMRNLHVNHASAQHFLVRTMRLNEAMPIEVRAWLQEHLLALESHLAVQKELTRDPELLQRYRACFEDGGKRMPRLPLSAAVHKLRQAVVFGYIAHLDTLRASLLAKDALVPTKIVPLIIECTSALVVSWLHSREERTEQLFAASLTVFDAFFDTLMASPTARHLLVQSTAIGAATLASNLMYLGTHVVYVQNQYSSRCAENMVALPAVSRFLRMCLTTDGTPLQAAARKSIDDTELVAECISVFCESEEHAPFGVKLFLEHVWPVAARCIPPKPPSKAAGVAAMNHFISILIFVHGAASRLLRRSPALVYPATWDAHAPLPAPVVHLCCNALLDAEAQRRACSRLGDTLEPLMASGLFSSQSSLFVPHHRGLVESLREVKCPAQCVLTFEHVLASAHPLHAAFVAAPQAIVSAPFAGIDAQHPYVRVRMLAAGAPHVPFDACFPEDALAGVARLDSTFIDNESTNVTTAGVSTLALQGEQSVVESATPAECKLQNILMLSGSYPSDETGVEDRFAMLEAQGHFLLSISSLPKSGCRAACHAQIDTFDESDAIGEAVIRLVRARSGTIGPLDVVCVDPLMVAPPTEAVMSKILTRLGALGLMCASTVVRLPNYLTSDLALSMCAVVMPDAAGTPSTGAMWLSPTLQSSSTFCPLMNAFPDAPWSRLHAVFPFVEWALTVEQEEAKARSADQQKLHLLLKHMRPIETPLHATLLMMQKSNAAFKEHHPSWLAAKYAELDAKHPRPLCGMRVEPRLCAVGQPLQFRLVAERDIPANSFISTFGGLIYDLQDRRTKLSALDRTHAIHAHDGRVQDFLPIRQLLRTYAPDTVDVLNALATLGSEAWGYRRDLAPWLRPLLGSSLGCMINHATRSSANAQWGHVPAKSGLASVRILQSKTAILRGASILVDYGFFGGPSDRSEFIDLSGELAPPYCSKSRRVMQRPVFFLAATGKIASTLQGAAHLPEGALDLPEVNGALTSRFSRHSRDPHAAGCSSAALLFVNALLWRAQHGAGGEKIVLRFDAEIALVQSRLAQGATCTLPELRTTICQHFRVADRPVTAPQDPAFVTASPSLRDLDTPLPPPSDEPDCPQAPSSDFIAACLESWRFLHEFYQLLHPEKDDARPGRMREGDGFTHLHRRSGSVYLIEDLTLLGDEVDPHNTAPLIPVRDMPARGDGDCALRAAMLAADPVTALASGRDFGGCEFGGQSLLAETRAFESQAVKTTRIELTRMAQSVLDAAHTRTSPWTFLLQQLQHTQGVVWADGDTRQTAALQRLVGHFERLHQHLDQDSLAFLSVGLECRLAYFWPYVPLPPSSLTVDRTPGVCTDWASGILTNNQGETIFFPSQRAFDDGWQWEQPRSAAASGLLLKLESHWDGLTAAPDLLVFVNHPLLPDGWTPGLLHPILHHIGCDVFAQPFAMYDMSAAALALQTRRGQAARGRRHHMRVGDIIEYSSANDSIREGVVMLIMVARSTDEDKSTFIRKKIQRSRDKENIAGRRKATNAESAEDTRAEALLCGNMPSVRFMVMPTSLLKNSYAAAERVAAPAGEEGAYPADFYKLVHPNNILSVIEYGSEFGSRFSTGAAQPCTNSVELLGGELPEECSTWMSTFLHDFLIDPHGESSEKSDKPQALCGLLNTAPARQLELIAAWQNDLKQSVGDLDTLTVSPAQSTLYHRAIALSSGDGYALAEFKNAYRRFRRQTDDSESSHPYRTTHWPWNLAIYRRQAGAFHTRRIAEISTDDMAVVLRAYSAESLVSAGSSAAQRAAFVTAVQARWRREYEDCADARMPQSHAAVVQVSRTGKMVLWEDCSPQKKAEFRRCDESRAALLASALRRRQPLSEALTLTPTAATLSTSVHPLTAAGSALISSHAITVAPSAAAGPTPPAPSSKPAPEAVRAKYLANAEKQARQARLDAPSAMWRTYFEAVDEQNRMYPRLAWLETSAMVYPGAVVGVGTGGPIRVWHELASINFKTRLPFYDFVHGLKDIRGLFVTRINVDELLCWSLTLMSKCDPGLYAFLDTRQSTGTGVSRREAHHPAKYYADAFEGCYQRDLHDQRYHWTQVVTREGKPVAWRESYVAEEALRSLEKHVRLGSVKGRGNADWINTQAVWASTPLVDFFSCQTRATSAVPWVRRKNGGTGSDASEDCAPGQNYCADLVGGPPDALKEAVIGEKRLAAVLLAAAPSAPQTSITHGDDEEESAPKLARRADSGKVTGKKKRGATYIYEVVDQREEELEQPPDAASASSSVKGRRGKHAKHAVGAEVPVAPSTAVSGGAAESAAPVSVPKTSKRKRPQEAPLADPPSNREERSKIRSLAAQSLLSDLPSPPHSALSSTRASKRQKGGAAEAPPEPSAASGRKRKAMILGSAPKKVRHGSAVVLPLTHPDRVSSSAGSSNQTANALMGLSAAPPDAPLAKASPRARVKVTATGEHSDCDSDSVHSASSPPNASSLLGGTSSAATGSPSATHVLPTAAASAPHAANERDLLAMLLKEQMKSSKETREMISKQGDLMCKLMEQMSATTASMQSFSTNIVEAVIKGIHGSLAPTITALPVRGASQLQLLPPQVSEEAPSAALASAAASATLPMAEVKLKPLTRKERQALLKFENQVSALVQSRHPGGATTAELNAIHLEVRSAPPHVGGAHRAPGPGWTAANSASAGDPPLTRQDMHLMFAAHSQAQMHAQVQAQSMSRHLGAPLYLSDADAYLGPRHFPHAFGHQAAANGRSNMLSLQSAQPSRGNMMHTLYSGSPYMAAGEMRITEEVDHYRGGMTNDRSPAPELYTVPQRISAAARSTRDSAMAPQQASFAQPANATVSAGFSPQAPFTAPQQQHPHAHTQQYSGY